MSEAIIVALITGACAIAANLIISKQSSRDLYAKLDKQSEVTDAKIQGQIDVIKADIRTLSNRVEAHNNVIERTYKLEGAVSELQHEVRDIKGGQ